MGGTMGGDGDASAWPIATAIAWATSFGVGSWAVAAGWRWPARTVAPAIGDRILVGDPAMVRVLVVTGGLKLGLAAGLALAWRRRWAPRLAGAAVQTAGLALAG